VQVTTRIETDSGSQGAGRIYTHGGASKTARPGTEAKLRKKTPKRNVPKPETMRHSYVFVAVYAAAVICVAACGSPATPSPAPTSTCAPGTTSKGSMSAVIDGVSWTAGCVVHAEFAAYAPGFNSLWIQGIDTPQDPTHSRWVSFVVLYPPDHPLVAGTYQFPGDWSHLDTVASEALVSDCADNGHNCVLWQTGYTNHQGSVTFATLTASGASGSFSFAGVTTSLNGLTEKVVTQGTFRVTF
jgi:hypothetical protein